MPTKRKSRPRPQPEGPALTGGTLSLTEEDRIFVHAVWAHGLQEASAKLKIDPDHLRKLLARKAVKHYLYRFNNEFTKQMAAWQVLQVTKFPVSRSDVISRLLALSLISPDETKGSIEGQVEALAQIGELLALKFNPRDAEVFFKDKTLTQLDNFARYMKFDPTEEEKKAIDDAAAATHVPKPDDPK